MNCILNKGLWSEETHKTGTEHRKAKTGTPDDLPSKYPAEWTGELCKADFFTAPVSTHYHGGYEGGLC